MWCPPGGVCSVYLFYLCLSAAFLGCNRKLSPKKLHVSVQGPPKKLPTGTMQSPGVVGRTRTHLITAPQPSHPPPNLPRRPQPKHRAPKRENKDSILLQPPAHRRTLSACTGTQQLLQPRALVPRAFAHVRPTRPMLVHRPGPSLGAPPLLAGNGRRLTLVTVSDCRAGGPSLKTCSPRDSTFSSVTRRSCGLISRVDTPSWTTPRSGI